MSAAFATPSPRGTLPERAPPTGISVLVVGGGVAGLMAGLECWRKGHAVRIVEKSPARITTGDVLTIGTSAIRAIKRWPDMAAENDRISYEMWVSWHKINGDLLSGPAPFRPNPGNKGSPGQKADGDAGEAVPKIYRHRHPLLQKMLADQVARAGIEVEYARHVVEYQEDPESPTSKARVVLQDGGTIEADLVVAADGIGSKSYNITLGRPVPARPTGFSIYRALLPSEQALTDPAIEDKFPLLEGGMSATQLWMGEQVYALFQRTREEMAWYITYMNKGSSEESWSHRVDPEAVLQTTATIDGWPAFADALIRRTTKEQIHDFKLVWRDPQPCWVSKGGRVVQLGDAAHSFLPSSGNGATQGLEDAVSLASCLQLAGKGNVHWAARVHNKLRFERVSCVQLLGVLNHEMRNRSSNPSAAQTKPIGILGAWIWRHDPEAYAAENYDKALAHLTSGAAFQNTNIPKGHVCKPWTIDEILDAKEAGNETLMDGDWD